MLDDIVPLAAEACFDDIVPLAAAVCSEGLISVLTDDLNPPPVLPLVLNNALNADTNPLFCILFSGNMLAVAQTKGSKKNAILI
jgi:hypothetical protein